ncbi:hypothetical protein MTR67_007084 [Solanum verrucosum]|uniref:Uncharacterized protein n=1 Tax=Solanum verrucosum TaxID=315347 RepID=A0AAF0Q5E8_SOLVR|nr:hypothetical protein MTR67_007084 [Solanum verrucosum]
MAKMMTQLYLLSKHVIKGRLKLVNAVGNTSGQCLDDAMFEELYNEENQMRDSHPNYQWKGGNKD